MYACEDVPVYLGIALVVLIATVCAVVIAAAVAIAMDKL